MGVVRRERRSRTRVGHGLVVAAALTPTLLLVACGSSGQPQQSATSAPPPSAASPTAGSLPTAPISGADPTTLQGTVAQGVESGCVVLVDASGAVLANLQGWDLQAHPFDSQVEVTGAFEPDMMTTCQQGAPFEASTVVSR